MCSLSVYRRGVAIFQRTESRPGTMMAPGEVAASTSRRHKCGYWCANCCARPPPPRDAGDVDLLVAKLSDEARGQSGEGRRAVWQSRHRRAAHAGDVENDRGGVRQRIEERPCQFPVCANPVEQQQWWPAITATPDCDRKGLPSDRDISNVDLRRLIFD